MKKIVIKEKEHLIENFGLNEDLIDWTIKKTDQQTINKIYDEIHSQLDFL